VLLRSALWLVFVVALGEALQIHTSRQPPLAYLLLSVSLGCALLATLVPLQRLAPARAIAVRGERPLLLLALAGLLLQLWALATAQPSWSIKPGHSVFAVLVLGVLTCALLAALGIAERDPLGRARLPLFLAVHLALGLYVVHATPDPWIDVYQYHLESFKELLAGRSPYGHLTTNIYRGYPFPFMAPELLTPDGAFVKVGFPYPPLQLLLTLPAHLIAGDYRYVQAIAFSVSGLLMALARPGRMAAIAAALFLLTPRLFFMLEGSWTEPTVVLFLSLTLFCAARAPRLLPWALGGLFGIKQYAIVLAPLAAFLLPEGERTPRATVRLLAKAFAIAAAITLPFFLWSPRGFLADVLLMQMRQPFRLDSLSFMALWHLRGIVTLPSWTCFVLLGALLLAARLFAERDARGFAGATALAFGFFFATGKQAFVNYYVFALASGAWALALSAPRNAATTAQFPQTVNQGA